MSALVIVNLIAGSGVGKELYDDLKKEKISGFFRSKLNILFSEPISNHVIFTTANSQWLDEAKVKLDSGKYQAVIVIGGDGTLMQIAPLLMNYPQTALFAVPAGRGNDWIRGVLNYHSQTSQSSDFWDWCVHQKKVWQHQKLDLAQVACDQNQTKVFLNMASLGYGGDVVEKSKTRKAFWSKSSLVYQVEGALAMLETRSTRCVLKCNDVVFHEDAFFGGFVGNGRANGRGLYWTRNALLNDGKLDAIIFPKPGIWEMIQSLQLVKEEKAPVFKCSEVQSSILDFQFDTKTALELDGEFMGSFSMMRFQVIPEALKVITL